MQNEDRYTRKVLDHGYVKLLNLAGPVRRKDREFDADDTDPARTARHSFGNQQADRTRGQDMRLNRYLFEHWHTTPIESIEVWLEMKLPIFVARHFVRHRTSSINEISGRYVSLPDQFYIPDVVGKQPDTKKQGRSDEPLNVEIQERFKNALRAQCEESLIIYREAIADGVAYEHARLFLHLNHYTVWAWKQNLHNMMHLLALREHTSAQWEDQEYADAIINLLDAQLPGLMELYREFRRIKS